MPGRSRDRARTRCGGTTFLPTQLSGCALWLRADRGVTESALAVSSWQNYGTLGGTFDQATPAAKPALAATGGGNSQASLTFDGGDYLASSLASSSWTFLHSASSTVFVVWRTTSANPNTYYGVLSTAAGGSTNRGVSLFYDDRSGLSRNDCVFAGVNNGAAWVAQSISASNAFPAATWGVSESVFEYGASGNDLNAFTNGTSVISVDSTAVPSGSAPQGSLEIGRLVSDTGSRLVGSISEVIAYNSALSASDRWRVRRYLGTRYALTVV